MIFIIIYFLDLKFNIEIIYNNMARILRQSDIIMIMYSILSPSINIRISKYI